MMYVFKRILNTLILPLALSGTLSAQMDTISIDFGNIFSPSPWNNISDPVAGTIADLINHDNEMTGIAISVFDAFNNINTGGTQAPNPALGIPPTASGDSFFGNVGSFGGQEQPTAGIELTQLDTGKIYTISLFASRDATDNREAQYVVEGQQTDTLFLNASSNTDMVAEIDMLPDGEGRIRVTASPGPNNDNSTGFYYLGSLQLFYEDTPGVKPRDTVLVDFGDDLSPLPWNNISNPADASVSTLLNQKGETVLIGLAVIDSFNNINRAGTQSPDSALGIPPTASGDSFFGNVAAFGGQTQPTAAIQFNQLTPGKKYALTLFASRDATDNREAQYIITGASTDTLYLDASSNTDMVVSTELEPDTNGLITIHCSPGPNNDNSSGFYYLGALKCSFEADPPLTPKDTILIDFGNNPSPLPWNNFSNPADGDIPDLMDGNSLPTGFGIAVVDSFNNINSAGTQSPDPALGFPASATGDSFFGNVGAFGGQVQPTGAVQLYNLNKDFIYTLTLFASRDATDNREAQYIIAGEGTDTVYLNASSNTGMVATAVMAPDTFGNILVTASPGPNNDNGTGFYYLGVLKMTWELNPALAVNDTILIDFGNTPSPLPWNNISDPNAGSIEDLLFSNTFSSGVSIEIYDDFNNINTNGTLNPDPALGIPPTASGDSFFGNIAEFGGQVQPTAALLLSHLDPEVPVEVVLFASRTASDNRETQYIVSGNTTDTLFLDVASNEDMVASTTLQPAANGTIDIHVSTGPNNTNPSGFYYLGAMKVIYESTNVPVASLGLLSPNGGEFWQVGKTPSIRWQSKNVQQVLLEYSTDSGQNWNPIGTVPAVSQEYVWTVPNTPTEQALVRITADTLSDVSDAVFTISDDNTDCTIVVLGSSTAEGAGASNDSSWVERYTALLTQNNTKYSVVNLARGGYTTYHILPDGTPIPGGVGISIDSERNMTKALTYQPSAIIINMPSNDTGNGFSAAMQLENYEILYQAGEAAGARTYLATTQPRNFADPAQVMTQLEVRDSILIRYGDQSIDFWSGIATPDGWIDSLYDSGDGVHVNDAGHAILFDRVVEKRIDTVSCDGSVGLFELKEQTLDQLRVYPNPFSERLLGSLDAEMQGTLEFKLYDPTGRLVWSGTQHVAGPGRAYFNISEVRQLPASMYYLHARWSTRDDTKSGSYQVLKQ